MDDTRLFLQHGDARGRAGGAEKNSVLVREIFLGLIQEQIRKWLELVLFTGTLDLMRCTELMPYVKKTFAHVSR